jgi:hypothetical protein
MLTTPGAMLIDVWCQRHDDYTIISSDFFWFYIILINTLFWIAVWFMGTTISSIVFFAFWIYERACYACVRATSTSGNISFAANASSPMNRTTTTSPPYLSTLPLVSIELTVHLTMYDALRTIAMGVFLCLYGTTVAVAWACQMLLHWPAVTLAVIFTASAGTVFSIDA